jgi:hypothetical protein
VGPPQWQPVVRARDRCAAHPRRIILLSVCGDASPERRAPLDARSPLLITPPDLFFIPSRRASSLAGVSSLTWVLPDRFNDNELTLEAVHTAINLLSAFHDGLINDPPPGAPPGAAQLSFALTALQQVEVLVELWGQWAQGKGRLESRYDPLIAIEGLK